MASLGETTKILCSLCNKAKGIYKCQGCSQLFCPKHSNDHRNELNKQLEEITMTHDLVQQTLNQQTEDPQNRPLIQQINQWEKKSIDLVRKTAEKLRQELLDGVTQDITQIKQNLQSLSNELREGREENDFSEIDLRQWTQRLEQLKSELLNPTTITLQEDSISLINNIRINHRDISDAFERVFSNAQIEEDGRLVVKVGSSGHTEIRGKGEYNAGRHTICFRIEQLEQKGWVFFGIISKTQVMQFQSYSAPSSYGWSNRNQIFSRAQHRSEQTLEIIQNDVVLLTIDCNQRKIQLTNKRLNRSMELTVDIQKCAFPWQIHLNLHQANTQVRIVDSIG